LQTGADINQVQDTGFNTDFPTVFACNIGSCKYIAQVYKDGVRLISGTEEVQRVNLDMTSDIVFATVVDPYLALLTEQGQVIVLCFVEDRFLTTLTQLHKVSSFTNFSNRVLFIIYR